MVTPGGGTERAGILGRLLAAESVPHFGLDHGDPGVDTSGLSKRLAPSSPHTGRTATGQAESPGGGPSAQGSSGPSQVWLCGLFPEQGLCAPHPGQSTA